MSEKEIKDTNLKDLIQISAEHYGHDFQAHLMDQYKLYVQMADNVSARRTSANNYLLTVNAFLITLYGVASSALSGDRHSIWLYIVPISGILVCLTWLALIKSYKDLNTAKFKVIHGLEKFLPAALFDHEWDLAQRGKGKAYRPLTHIEPLIPWVFAVLYLFLAIFALF